MRFQASALGLSFKRGKTKFNLFLEGTKNSSTFWTGRSIAHLTWNWYFLCSKFKNGERARERAREGREGERAIVREELLKVISSLQFIVVCLNLKNIDVWLFSDFWEHWKNWSVQLTFSAAIFPYPHICVHVCLTNGAAWIFSYHQWPVAGIWTHSSWDWAR